jgi:hypothetical protein
VLAFYFFKGLLSAPGGIGACPVHSALPPQAGFFGCFPLVSKGQHVRPAPAVAPPASPAPSPLSHEMAPWSPTPPSFGQCFHFGDMDVSNNLVHFKRLVSRLAESIQAKAEAVRWHSSLAALKRGSTVCSSVVPLSPSPFLVQDSSSRASGIIVNCPSLPVDVLLHVQSALKCRPSVSQQRPGSDGETRHCTSMVRRLVFRLGQRAPPQRAPAGHCKAQCGRPCPETGIVLCFVAAATAPNRLNGRERALACT